MKNLCNLQNPVFADTIKKKRLVLQLHKAETFQAFSLKAAACSPKFKYIPKCDLDSAHSKDLSNGNTERLFYRAWI